MRVRSQTGKECSTAMAFVVITADTDEIEHRELTGPLTIGRSADCDISIRDVLLSRRHCQIEPGEFDDQWVVVDLESKNKTKVNGRAIERVTLDDGDIVRVGKTRLLFHAGVFVAPSMDARRRRIRPSDPHEALAGTVAGFALLEPGSTPRTEFFPTPQPSPKRPRAYEEDGVDSLLSGIASSSWDSIVTGVRAQTRTVRATPQPVMREVDLMHVLESDESPEVESIELGTPVQPVETNLFETTPVETTPFETTSVEAPSLLALEAATNELRDEARQMDALAVDALQALGQAVAEARAAVQARAASSARVDGASTEVSSSSSTIKLHVTEAVPVEVKSLQVAMIRRTAEVFGPTPGAAGMRWVCGILATAAGIIVAGSVLIGATLH